VHDVVRDGRGGGGTYAALATKAAAIVGGKFGEAEHCTPIKTREHDWIAIYFEGMRSLQQRPRTISKQTQHQQTTRSSSNKSGRRHAQGRRMIRTDLEDLLELSFGLN